MVRALTSAIDAKDPYTCGHSDRVGQVARRLAQEMGGDSHMLATIYLGGLLHDTGKIGIDDTVLRKEGRLTDAEYEHIKTHAEIGYRILAGLKQLDDVLPVVLAPSRTMGRQGLSAWAGGRKHSADGADRRRGRFVRRHDQRPPLSQGHARRAARRDHARRGRQPVGCPAWSKRSSALATTFARFPSAIGSASASTVARRP